MGHCYGNQERTTDTRDGAESSQISVKLALTVQ